MAAIDAERIKKSIDVIIIPWAIIILWSVVACHGIHRWVLLKYPLAGEKIPRDAGAWSGIAIGILKIYLFGPWVEIYGRDHRPWPVGLRIFP